jgi:integrase
MRLSYSPTSRPIDIANGPGEGGLRLLEEAPEAALLSALFVGLVEDKVATANPCHGLPRSTRRLMKPTHDPRTTPFIEKVADVRRIFLLLPPPLNIAYAVGVLAGLRTGEIFALRWLHVDVVARRIHVRESVKGPLKDKDSRVVPILDPLLPILTEWKPSRRSGSSPAAPSRS